MKVFYIQPTFDTSRPRNIRTANIVNILKEIHDIEVFTFSTKAIPREIEGVKITRMPYHGVSKWFINRHQYGYRHSAIMQPFVKAVSYIIRQFLWPDVWIFEKHRIQKFVSHNASYPDIIVCSMMPFSMGKTGLELKEKHYPNAKLVFDIGDPLSNNSAHELSNSAKYCSYEKRLLGGADGIVVTNEATKAYYVDSLKLDAEKIFVIPQGVDTALFKPTEKKVSIKSGIKLVYAGSFYPKLRDPEPLLESVAKTEGVSIDIYGGVSSIQGEGVLYAEKVSQQELVEKISKCDWLVFIDNAYGMQTSGKIFELLSLKMPILFIYRDTNSKVYQDAKKYKNVYFVMNEHAAVAEALKEMKNIEYGQEDYNYDVAHFSWKERANRFREVFENVS